MTRGATINPKWHMAFADLADLQGKVILSKMKTTPISKGMPLFVQGSPSRRLFVIQSGRVSIVQGTESGHEFIIGICSAGSTVGLSTVALDVIHNVSAITIEQSSVSSMKREDLIECMRMFPVFGVNIAKLLAMMVVESFDQRAYMALSPTQIRLATLLLSLAQGEDSRRHSQCVELSGLTQEDLARMIGVGRPWISQKLRSLEEKGLIRRCGRRILITDIRKLSAFIGAEKLRYATVS